MTTIELCIEDDGSMYVETGEKETPTEEQGEGGNRTPVKSLDEAMQMIKQLAQSAAMPSEQQPDQENAADASAPGEEEDAMMSGYRGGVTGR